jgi:hypothetical protein
VPRSLAAALGALASALLVAGCVSIPNGGPVYPYPGTQGAGAQNQPYAQLIPKPPQPGGAPDQIVRGFLAASASFADGQRMARQFLTQTASHAWQPAWSATVFKGAGPQVGTAVYPDPGNKNLAKVTVSGKVQAELSTTGGYAVPSASGGSATSVTLTLVRTGGQWRISSPPGQLLLTGTEFTADYQLRNLYFFDQGSQFLVPDPVYVPLQTTPANLLSGLVRALITHHADWLQDGTRTAFPSGTKLLSDVVVNGDAAEVNLGGAIAEAGDTVREMISGQLLSTLSGSGQGQPDIQSVVLEVNGKPWSPPRAQQNPVQNSTTFSVPDGKSDGFYYLNSQGEIIRQPVPTGSPVKVRSLGSGYSAIAVSPDGRYLAALKNGTLYTGLLAGGALLMRQGSGYTTMSWDAHDQLWATANGGLAMLRGNVTARSPQALTAPETVFVTQNGGFLETNPITAVRVAPDGVRVVLIIREAGVTPSGAAQASTAMAFGAIAGPVSAPSQSQMEPRPGQFAGRSLQIKLSPFSVSGGAAGFSSVSWYGADDVVTLSPASSGKAPQITEYSVNGASSTIVSTEPGITSITTSANSELVAGATGGELLTNPGTGGTWASAGNGLAPAYPG